ncbi:MAG: 2-oxo-4-hydroxy-4-carboxy-5-ureidoimidazoline decarboxylase [Vicinamibacterales bacterium]
MHNLPGKLTADELAALFEGKTRFVKRLALHENPLGAARRLLREIPEDEVLEAINAHPRIGGGTGSSQSTHEQGTERDPEVLGEFGRLNQRYEEKFGFRFVVFVNGRSRSEILKVLRHRLQRTRDEELVTAIDDLVSIAEDRYRRGVLKQNGGRR